VLGFNREAFLSAASHGGCDAFVQAAPQHAPSVNAPTFADDFDFKEIFLAEASGIFKGALGGFPGGEAASRSPAGSWAKFSTNRRSQITHSS
jgi:hypothetical protein